jgi:hypothetical protein
VMYPVNLLRDYTQTPIVGFECLIVSSHFFATSEFIQGAYRVYAFCVGYSQTRKRIA